ncbi:hypothetical protein [Streptomyces sp. NPDC047706]|uniref:hypothetical protein n=1 Tax=Streptomyces sp. NPDC047706 TaxID=3365486 RepID=UPI0037160F71
MTDPTETAARDQLRGMALSLATGTGPLVEPREFDAAIDAYRDAVLAAAVPAELARAQAEAHQYRTALQGVARRAAVPAGQAPATDRSGLRQRIAAALYERERPPCDPHWPDVYAADREVFEAMADAVLSVLPAHPDRATVLREAATAALLRTADLIAQRADNLWAPGSKPHTEMHAEADGLRQLAEETPAAREWCKCSSCWGWFVEEHPGEDLDELGKDLRWWSGLPEHRDQPAAEARQAAEDRT